MLLLSLNYVKMEISSFPKRVGDMESCGLLLQNTGLSQLFQSGVLEPDTPAVFDRH